MFEQKMNKIYFGQANNGPEIQIYVGFFHSRLSERTHLFTFCTVKIMILSRYRYRPVTVFGQRYP